MDVHIITTHWTYTNEQYAVRYLWSTILSFTWRLLGRFRVDIKYENIAINVDYHEIWLLVGW